VGENATQKFHVFAERIDAECRSMMVHIRNFEHGVRLCWWILLAVVIGLIVLTQ